MRCRLPERAVLPGQGPKSQQPAGGSSDYDSEVDDYSDSDFEGTEDYKKGGW